MPVGTAERDVVAYCSKDGYGTRLIPPNTFKSLHYMWVSYLILTWSPSLSLTQNCCSRTPHYVQITGLGDVSPVPPVLFNRTNFLTPWLIILPLSVYQSQRPTKGRGWRNGSVVYPPPSCHFGCIAEFFPFRKYQILRGKYCITPVRVNPSMGPNLGSIYSADGHGNPAGGLVFGEKGQFDRWTEFLAYDEFSLRACFNSDVAYKYCEHICKLSNIPCVIWYLSWSWRYPWTRWSRGESLEHARRLRHSHLWPMWSRWCSPSYGLLWVLLTVLSSCREVQ
jgi:hypothetical protein